MKIQIKSICGSILFEYEKENNIVKETVLKALKEHANLRGANLCGANLRGANLSNADFRDADLSDANLCGANLCGANLCGANLRGANLCNADFRDADLSNADFRDADLSNANLSNADFRDANLRSANLSNADFRGAKNKEEAKLPIYCKWNVSHKGNTIQIGCKENNIEGWDAFFASDEEYSTKRDTEEFKQIQACYKGYKAYVMFLNQTK